MANPAHRLNSSMTIQNGPIEGRDSTQCPVCFEMMLPTQRCVTHANCRRTFHLECIQNWMQSFNGAALATCPIDRMIIEAPRPGAPGPRIPNLPVSDRPGREFAVYDPLRNRLLGGARAEAEVAIVVDRARYNFTVHSANNVGDDWGVLVSWASLAGTGHMVLIDWPAFEARWGIPRAQYRHEDGQTLSLENLHRRYAPNDESASSLVQDLKTRNPPASEWLEDQVRFSPRLAWNMRLLSHPDWDMMCIVANVPVPGQEGIEVACFSVPVLQRHR